MQERRRFECGQPQDNIRLLQAWNRAGWSVSAREGRYGDYCSLTLNAIDDQTYEAEWLTDLEVGYRWGQYTFAAGAENLFDTFPDENRLFRPGTSALTQQAGTGGTNSYPINTPFGMNGRFFYTRIGRSF